MRTCTICNRKYKASGFCERHYAQLMKYGEITFPIKKIQMITLECKKCNRKWKFYPKFLESKSFDDLYWDNYEKKGDKHYILCSKCVEKKTVPAI